MAKTCPSCGYQPIGPFTDNCPLCAEPVQSGFERGHASGRSPAVWWALIGAAVLLCCVGYYGFGQWRGGRVARDVKKEIARLEANGEADRKARTVTVLAAQLLHEFQGDPVAADQKYRRKHLEISGVVEHTGAPPRAPYRSSSCTPATRAASSGSSASSTSRTKRARPESSV